MTVCTCANTHYSYLYCRYVLDCRKNKTCIYVKAPLCLQSPDQLEASFEHHHRAKIINHADCEAHIASAWRGGTVLPRFYATALLLH